MSVLGSQRLLVVFLFMAAPSAALAQATRTIELDGKRFELQADDKRILVRLKKPMLAYNNLVEQSRHIAELAIEGQARVMKIDSKPHLALLKNWRPAVLPTVNGFLVPKLSGFHADDHAKLAANMEIDAVQPVYQYVPKLHALPPRSTVKEGMPRKTQPQVVVLRGTVSAYFRQAPTLEQLKKLETTYDMKISRRRSYVPQLIQFRPNKASADTFALTDKLRGNEISPVATAHPDLVYAIAGIGDAGKPAEPARQNPAQRKQYYLDTMLLPKAWAIDRPKEDALVVAVVDDGVDIRHGDLMNKIAAGGISFLDPKKPGEVTPAPADAHGTACAGIIAGQANNGLSGIARSARVLPIRIYANLTEFVDDNVIATAIEYAVDAKKARICNLSWGFQLPLPWTKAAMASRRSKCLFVAAAGNYPDSADTFYPARYAHFCVGALKKDDTLWDYSCWGPGLEVNIVAPTGDWQFRGDIWTTDHAKLNGWNKGNGNTPGESDGSGDYTERFGGTSAAAPMVAGVAAMLWSNFPELSPDDVKSCIEKSAVKVDMAAGNYQNDRSKYYGFGRVDAHGALLCARQLAAKKKPAAKQMPCVNVTQMQAALDPHAEVLKLDNESTDLVPDKSQLAVAAPVGVIPPDADFWKVVDRDKVDPSRPGKEIARAGSYVFYLIPREAIHSDIMDFAKKGPLPAVRPVYYAKEAPVIPSGKINLILKSSQDQAEARACFEKLKLDVVQVKGTGFVVELTANAPFPNVFAACRALEKMPFTSVCWPSIYQRIQR